MCYESNFIDSKKKYLLIDSCTTIDVINIMQGFLNLKSPIGSEEGFRNGMHLHIEVVGTCKLVLENGYVLDLENTFYYFS